MSDKVQLTPGDSDTVRNFVQYVRRQLDDDAASKIFQGTFFSASIDSDVYCLVGFGEQARALQQLFTRAQATAQTSRLIAPDEIDITPSEIEIVGAGY